MNTLIAGLCAVIATVSISAGVNLKATNDTKKEVKNASKMQAETYIENDYHKEYHYYEDNKDNEKELETLKEEVENIKIDLEEEQKKTEDKDEVVLVGIDEYGVVRNLAPQTTTVKDPWRGPKSYKCDKIAGYPAECEYCGEIGEIHFNIKEWQDKQGTYHVTHVGCKDKCLNQYKINY